MVFRFFQQHHIHIILIATLNAPLHTLKAIHSFQASRIPNAVCMSKFKHVRTITKAMESLSVSHQIDPIFTLKLFQSNHYEFIFSEILVDLCKFDKCFLKKNRTVKDS